MPQHFCVLGVPAPAMVSFGLLGWNAAIVVDEIRHRHLLCASKDIFWKVSLPLASFTTINLAKANMNKTNFTKKCEASYIHNTFHAVVSVLADSRGQ